jgi:hypothetical protein
LLSYATHHCLHWKDCPLPAMAAVPVSNVQLPLLAPNATDGEMSMEQLVQRTRDFCSVCHVRSRALLTGWWRHVSTRCRVAFFVWLAVVAFHCTTAFVDPTSSVYDASDNGPEARHLNASHEISTGFWPIPLVSLQPLEPVLIRTRQVTEIITMIPLLPFAAVHVVVPKLGELVQFLFRELGLALWSFCEWIHGAICWIAGRVVRCVSWCIQKLVRLAQLIKIMFLSAVEFCRVLVVAFQMYVLGPVWKALRWFVCGVVEITASILQTVWVYACAIAEVLGIYAYRIWQMAVWIVLRLCAGMERGFVFMTNVVRSWIGEPLDPTRLLL